jgi:transcriptional regulator with XRE-family HTH domain
MMITVQLTDESVLEELGARLTSARLGRNLTQAALAEQAGVSKRTLERLESGAVATQLSSFLRVCRVLGLVEQFESLVPAASASPMEQLKRQGGKRRRASGKKAGPAKPGKWTWGDES